MNGPYRAKAITILNLKGGVGKTHTVWLLAGVCLERGRKLLAVDTDTQANLTRSLLSEAEELSGIEALFDPAADVDVQSLIRPTRFSGIDIIPARGGERGRLFIRSSVKANGSRWASSRWR